MKLDVSRIKGCLQRFDFQRLFTDELGWSQPLSRQAISFEANGHQFERKEVAQLAGVAVFEIRDETGHIPDAKTRSAVHKEVAKHHHENVLIFLDGQRTQSLWYWAKRQDGKTYPRDHLYVQGQPGDLFVSKLGQMVFDISEFDETGNVSLVEVARRVRAALDVERVTKKFFSEFQEQHLALLDLIEGVADEHQRRWYASVLLNRLMFIYFLQKKDFLDGGDVGKTEGYLRRKLNESQAKGKNRYFQSFLKLLFFEGFAKPEGQRSAEARAILGSIPYLNGGLFLPHKVEQDNPRLNVLDRAFEELFDLFDRYSWNLDDTPGGKDDEINPDVLGYIFEKYINQKAFGAYYTRPEITEYLCERTIHQLVLDAVNTPDSLLAHPPAGLKPRRFENLGDLLMDLDAPLCKRLWLDVLPRLSLLDPACGSGAFLVAAMKVLINLYGAVIGRAKMIGDPDLRRQLSRTESEHPSIAYYIKKTIITDNLFGVDIMEEATEIAKLRLFLALVSSAHDVTQLEPLPNIDFNIQAGNSLIGLMRVDDSAFEKRQAQGNLFRKSYRQILEEKNRLIDNYRHATAYADDLTVLRNDIEEKKHAAYEALNDILLDEFKTLGIKYEQATWDARKNDLGKPEKRSLKPDDIERLRPFHWGFEFDEVLNNRGGFDAIITNPPWEAFKPNGKEFFEDHSNIITKKNMTVHAFEAEQARLLKDPAIRNAWLEYLSQFPTQSAFFRSSPQYLNQISVINGKKAGTDINLYKLFVEQCFNLLRPGGQCGMVIPSGIYTDLGSAQLREMLFTHCLLGPLFGFSNERFLFEGVHHSFKICIMSFTKGGRTQVFSAAFRINPREAIGSEQVESFLHSPSEHVTLSVPLIRSLSPDSVSVREFRSRDDIRILEKLLRFPMLGENLVGPWNMRLTAEFHMTNDSHLFHESPGKHRLPLYEGKMIHQFDHLWEPACRYWINETEGRAAILGRAREDTGQTLDYQRFRAGFRKVARTTDVRTLIAAMLPPNNFCSENFQTILRCHDSVDKPPDDRTCFYLVSVWNSFVLDYEIRMTVSANVNFFYVYQLRIPRLTTADPFFAAIVDRAARITCTTPDFDALAKEAGLKSHQRGITDPIKRAQLRAELDGLIAHLYGLTEAEFAHVLSTFPVVPDPAKVAAQNAYRDVERGLIK